jgi:hypothetical protein
VVVKTKFDPSRRQLTIGVGRNSTPSDSLPKMLLGEGILAEEMRVERRLLGVYLVLTLAEHDGLPACNLVCRLAERLSRIPGYLAVYDPWTIGGRAVNMELALDLIGDVFRHSSVVAAAAR